MEEECQQEGGRVGNFETVFLPESKIKSEPFSDEEMDTQHPGVDKFQHCVVQNGSSLAHSEEVDKRDDPEKGREKPQDQLADLKRQVVFLQQQMEDKDRTISLLQQQMSKCAVVLRQQRKQMRKE